jgi:D-alanyl-D-alanine dipeptidase
MLKIDPASLIPMDIFEENAPLRVDLAYTQPQPKSFCGIVYRPGARLWLHEDLALVVLKAAFLIHEREGYSSILYDGLRTTDAQALIRATPIVQANPHWLEGENRMLSPPGQGGHPRAMAVDIALEKDGELLDMGTDFDALAKDSSPAHNKAHRLYEGHAPQIYKNRDLLTGAMVEAGEWLGRAIRPLPSEWWDFRFLNEDYNRFAPLSDAELPPQMRMTGAEHSQGGPGDFTPGHFEEKRDALMKRL